MTFSHRLFAFLALWTFVGSPAHAQLRIATWNTYQSPSASVPAEIGQMETVLKAIGDQNRPGFSRTLDILLLQEQATNFSTTDRILNLLNGTNGAGGYARGTLTPVGGVNDIMQTVIYRTNFVQLVAETQATTINTNSGGTRATMRYQFRPLGYDSASDFYIYNSHLRPSDSTADANRRGVEVSELRANADALGEGTHIIYVGDMNFYRSTDAGFTNFTKAGAGQALDQVNAVGNWNNNASFIAVHTQNPRTAMDDRFDFQLATSEVLDGRGFASITNSYWAFGNTATHTFNGKINSGNSVSGLNAFLTNYTAAQISNIFDSLIALSDHLPVVVDYQLPASLGVTVSAAPSRAIVGVSITNSFTVGNNAPVSVTNGADYLDYSISGSGRITASGGGTNFALTAANNHSFVFSATNVGTNTGSLLVTANSPQAANANFTNNVSIDVLHHASASFASNSSVLSLELDLGSFAFGATNASGMFSLFNLPGAAGSAWTARLDLDSFSESDPSGVFSTTLSPFSNLAAGTSTSYAVNMAAAALGSFTGNFTLQLSDENLSGATTQSLNLAVRGTVTGNVAVGSGQTINQTNAITGTGALVKEGAGTLVLAASNNTFTGNTTVSSGVLALASGARLTNTPVITVASGAKFDVSAQTEAFTVVSGQKLAGSGTVEGDVVLQGKVSPGNSPGTLTITGGDLTWSAGGSYDWEIFDVDDGAGIGWDFINIMEGSLLFGGLSPATPFTINIFSLSGLPSTQGMLAGFNPAANYTWSILSASNPISGFNAANFTLNTSAFTTYNNLNGGLFSLEATNNELFLLYKAPVGQAVPEPATWFAAAALAVGTFLRIRRRWASSQTGV